MITYYNQLDLRWANTKIGNTNLKVGRWGCTLSSICVFLSWMGVPTNPGQLARVLGLFNGNAEIIWGQLSKATKGKISFEWRQYGRNDKMIKASLKDPKKLVLIQVNNGKHWVAALGVTPDGKDYWIADPDGGKRRQLFKTYPNITGSSHLKIV